MLHEFRVSLFPAERFSPDVLMSLQAWEGAHSAEMLDRLLGVLLDEVLSDKFKQSFLVSSPKIYIQDKLVLPLDNWVFELPCIPVNLTDRGLAWIVMCFCAQLRMFVSAELQTTPVSAETHQLVVCLPHQPFRFLAYTDDDLGIRDFVECSGNVGFVTREELAAWEELECLE